MVHCLLKAKAKVLVCNSEGCTAYTLASKLIPGHPVVTLLQAKEEAVRSKKSKKILARKKSSKSRLSATPVSQASEDVVIQQSSQFDAIDGDSDEDDSDGN